MFGMSHTSSKLGSLKLYNLLSPRKLSQLPFKKEKHYPSNSRKGLS